MKRDMWAEWLKWGRGAALYASPMLLYVADVLSGGNVHVLIIFGEYSL